MDLNDLLYATKRYDKDVKRLSAPLRDLLGIIHTRCYVVGKDNSVLLLDSELDCLKAYVKNKTYRYDPHITYPNMIKDGFVLWADIRDNDNSPKWLNEHRSYFERADGFTVVKKIDSGYYAFTFCSDKKNDKILNYYYNYKRYIDEYIKFAIEEIQHILKDTSEYGVGVDELRDQVNYGFEYITQDNLTKAQENDFLRMLKGEPNYVCT